MSNESDEERLYSDFLLMPAEVTQCPTCTRGKYEPFRRYDAEGRITMGCIDDFHSGHLTPISASNSWHERKSARAHRAAVKKHLKLITGRKVHDYRVCQCFTN